MVVEALEVEYESLIAFDAPLTLCIPNVCGLPVSLI